MASSFDPPPSAPPYNPYDFDDLPPPPSIESPPKTSLKTFNTEVRVHNQERDAAVQPESSNRSDKQKKGIVT